MHPEPISAGKKGILQNIARIGSLPFLEKACLQATREEYILLDELIDVTLTGLELELTSKVYATKWSQAERAALQDFVDRTNDLFRQIAWQDETLTLEAIVYEDPSMRMIRDAVALCLKRFEVNFSLEDLLD